MIIDPKLWIFRCLSMVPLKSMKYRFEGKFRGRMKKYITTKAFEEHLASMDPEGIGIDLGANIGEVTAMMAARLAKVFAFEPDPWTFERLKENTAHLSNVEVIHAAVSTSDGEIEIYRHRLFGADPLHGSVGTSTLAGHKAVDAQRSIRVPKVDFIRFLEELGQPVNLIKMDIEGAEGSAPAECRMTP